MLPNNRLILLPDVQELSWDSEIFGFRCGVLNIPVAVNSISVDELSSLIKATIRKAKVEKFRFLAAKIPAEIFTICAGCLRNTGILVDTELTFQKNTFKCSEFHVFPEIVVEKHDTFWDDVFYRIPDVLKHSRFFSDPNIDSALARKLWNTSIYNNCTGRASYSLVGFFRGKPAGLINVFERDGISDIFLIAVLPEYQGHGLGKAMMKSYESWLHYDVVEQIVETQVVNYPAQKLYSQMGYNNIRAKHTFHFWL